MRLDNSTLKGWSSEIRVAAYAVIEAGDGVINLSRTPETKAGEGHRSVITLGDNFSQEVLFGRLSYFADARFLAEEDTADPRAFPRDNPSGILKAKLVFIKDPIDGTVLYGSDLGGWSVVAGIMREGKLTASAVYAPSTNDGMLVVSETGQGVLVADWNGKIVFRSTKSLRATPPKNSVVLLGADTLLYPTIAGIVPRIAANVRAVFTAGSSAMGLAQIAAGRAQAVIQTPQKAWDWAGAYNAMIESGNVFHFYRLQEGELTPVERYDEAAFATMKETSANRLGFVAGEPELADKLFALLPREGWSRVRPDTVEGGGL